MAFNDRTTKEWWLGEIRQIPENAVSFEEAFAKRILLNLPGYAQSPLRVGQFKKDILYVAAALEAWDTLDDSKKDI